MLSKVFIPFCNNSVKNCNRRGWQVCNFLLLFLCSLTKQKSNGVGIISTPNNKQLKTIKKLLRLIRDDELINIKVTALLKLDVWKRRTVLNNWLQQLKKLNAPTDLQDALSCLFDDTNAKDVLKLISKNNHNWKIGG